MSVARTDIADAMQHGEDWAGEDLAGWIVTEKLDGCRAYWCGAQLWTRTGRPIAAPARITDRLPAGVALDGELWAGRGQYEAARLAVQAGRWTDAVRFVAFDAPAARGGYLDRLQIARGLVCAVEPMRAESTAHAMQHLAALLADGAEGLVARRAGGLALPGRGRDVLKLKAWALDPMTAN